MDRRDGPRTAGRRKPERGRGRTAPCDACSGVPPSGSCPALFRSFDTYLGSQRVAEILFSPADIEFDAQTLLQPDLFVYPVSGGAKPRSWRDIERLLLAIEVLSPNTARFDRHVKRLRYQRHGVPEYWIVDSDARLIERWRPEDERPEILGEKIIWHPEGAREPLTLDLPELFATLD